MTVNNIEICPHCNIKMDLKDAPYDDNGKIIGNFEAYVCPSCNRVFYTDNGYKELTKHIMKKK